MKKNYEKPEIEAIELEVEDIIQTSGLQDLTGAGLVDSYTNQTENIGQGDDDYSDWL